MFDFNDKTVLITGGSRGLGRAMSMGFARRGALVIIVSRKQSSCDQLAEEIRHAGGKAVGISANVGNIDEIDTLIDRCKRELGHIDILVNNAGISIGIGPLLDLHPDAFDKMYAVNLRGAWYLSTRVAAMMKDHGGGSMINILSVSALKPPANMGFYAATKAGLEALTKTMAKEWAPYNIRVNAVAPGSYRSDMVDHAISSNPDMEQGMIAATLLKRIAETDEIINPVFYLSSESYTTGITLVSDGGYMVN